MCLPCESNFKNIKNIQVPISSALQLYTLYPRRKDSLTTFVLHTADAVPEEFPSTVQMYTSGPL